MCQAIVPLLDDWWFNGLLTVLHTRERERENVSFKDIAKIF